MSIVSDKARKALLNEYKQVKSYQSMATKYDVSKGVMYNFLKFGIIPTNERYREKLGLVDQKNKGPSAKLLETRRRRATLNEIAVNMGYNNWANYETCVLRDWRHNQ